MHVKCDYGTISSLRSLRAEGGEGRGWGPETERRPVATGSCIVDEVIFVKALLRLEGNAVANGWWVTKWEPVGS